MTKQKYGLLSAAILGACPLVGNAVVMTFTYDPNDILVNGVVTALSGPSSAPTLAVFPGAAIDIGVDVDVTNNPNSTLAYHGTFDSAGGAQHYLQPQNLGIAVFGMGFNTSSQSIAPFDPIQDNGNVNINTNFSALTDGGQFDGNNNILIATVGGGNLMPTVNSATTEGVSQIGYAAGTPAELFNALQIDAGTIGTAIITPTGIADENMSYTAYKSGGTTTSSEPVYKSVAMRSTDTLVQLPALTIVVSAVPEPATATLIGLGAMGLLLRRRATR